MIKLLIGSVFVFTLSFSLTSFAAKSKKKYEYKKYERFDFEALNIEGNQASPGDLSIGPRFKKKFRNKLPEKRNFNREMKKAIDSIL